MWEELKEMVQSFFAEHHARKMGMLVGMLLAVAILVFGFWDILFVLLCGCIGLYIGARLDHGDDLVETTLEKLQKYLPERFQRW